MGDTPNSYTGDASKYTPNIEIAQAFAEAYIALVGGTLSIRTFSESPAAIRRLQARQDEADAAHIESGEDGKARRVNDPLCVFLHGMPADLAGAITRLQQQGAGVFFMPNEGDGSSTLDRDVRRARALFTDGDSGDTLSEKAIPRHPPHFIVHSARGPHGYWCCHSFDTEFSRQAQKRMAMRFKTDASINNPARVMRLPGTIHLKGEPTLVTWERGPATELYDAVEFCKQLPIERAAPSKNQRAEAPPDLRLDSEISIKRFERYIGRIPGVTMGGRNNRAVQIGALAGDFAVSLDRGIQIGARWNAMCDPPMSDTEFERAFSNGYRRRQNPIGCKLGEILNKHENNSQDDVGDMSADDDTGLHPDDFPRSRALLRDYPILRTQQAEQFLYCHTTKTFAPTIIESLKDIAIDYADPRHNSDSSRRNIVMDALAIARKSTPVHIPWNNISDTQVPFLNGVVDFMTGEWVEHDTDMYLNRIIPHELPRDFDELVPEVWLKTLDRWFRGDPEAKDKIRGLQQFFGYVLMIRARYKRGLLPYGPGETGKSRVGVLLRRMVGDEYTCEIDPDVMGDPRKLAPIYGKGLNILAEVDGSAVLSNKGWKKLVSNEEAVQLDPKFIKPFMYTPTCKHVLLCNELPRVDPTAGLEAYNRMLIIGFNNVIPLQERDKNLDDKLLAELPAVIAWALAGAKDLYERDGEFVVTEEAKSIIGEHRIAQNDVALFIQERCVVGEELWCPITQFQQAFAEWYGRHMAPVVLGRLLRKSGYTIIRKRSSESNRPWLYAGVDIRL